MTDTAPPPADADAQARRTRLEREAAAAEQLARVEGPLELQAAVLALLLPPGSQRALRAFQIETDGSANAEALRAGVEALAGTARLPVFESLLVKLRGQPLETRQRLLESTRRVMGARGVIRPIDRLHWFVMRQRLGGPSAAHARTAAASDLSQLPQAEVHAIATYSAFLARLVPFDEAEAEVDSGTEADAAAESPAQRWYDAAMAPWRARATIPPCRPPDTDAMVHALQELQALPWMQRPMLVRGWLGAALPFARHGRLSNSAADALRLTCTLLDSPQPPELARHYGDAGPYR